MIDPVTIMAAAMVFRMVAPVAKEGWKLITNEEAKKEKKRLEGLETDFKYKLELQRSSHKDRLEAAKLSHELAMEQWKQKTYYERCWPLRNPFEMQICKPISDDPFLGNDVIIPCRLISTLKDSDHPYAKTINGNLSSFIVNYYQANSNHAVVSEIGAWKDESPSNDASVNYLYAGLKMQPVMVLAPTLINDGKTFIFKVWSWGLGEDLNYPAGFEFGRLELKPLYLQFVYEETMSMIKLAKEMNYTPSKVFSQKLQHNISMIKEINDKKLDGKFRDQMLYFLKDAPEIDEAVKAKMERTISGIFCCISGVYADAYHLLEYKTLPKLPTLVKNNTIPGIEYMIQPLKQFYYELLTQFESIESDYKLLSDIHLDVADAFCQNGQNHKIIEPFLDRSLRLYALSENIIDTDKESQKTLTSISEAIQLRPTLMSSEYIRKFKKVSNNSSLNFQLTNKK